MLLLREGMIGIGAFFGYYIAMVLLLVIIKTCFKPSGELFRKMLHSVCAMSVFVLLYAFNTWYMAVLVVLAFALVLYPIIGFVERYPKLMEALHARRNGEIRSSLVIAFFMMATLIAFYWGLLGEQWKYIVIVAVMAWGFGDAAAALVGKSWGRNRIHHHWVEGTKTVEGSVAMYAVSSAAILVTLIVYTALPWYICLVVAALVAPVCAVVELVSHRGIDTITVPYATATSVFTLIHLLSFAGVVG